MYKVGQLFMFKVDGVRAIWAIIDVNKEKDEYTLECVENCVLKGMRKKQPKSKFDARITTELPRLIPAEEQESKNVDSVYNSVIKEESEVLV